MNDDIRTEETARCVIDSSIHIHKSLGPGLYENVYESILEFELLKAGHSVDRQHQLAIQWETLEVQRAYCIDLLVNGHLVVEIKSLERVAPVHLKRSPYEPSLRASPCLRVRFRPLSADGTKSHRVGRRRDGITL